MNNLLFGIILSALLSTTSLFVVLLRVSPLTAPIQAIPSFFLSAFLSMSTLAALGFHLFWTFVPVHTWDTGKLLSVSLRQGFFLGAAITIILLFHIFSLLNWWIAFMIFGVFLFTELALER